MALDVKKVPNAPVQGLPPTHNATARQATQAYPVGSEVFVIRKLFVRRLTAGSKTVPV
jgi:hypothetical protein